MAGESRSVNRVVAAEVALLTPEWAPADPTACREETLGRLGQLAAPGPLFATGELLNRDDVQRAWIRARCANCRACLPR